MLDFQRVEWALGESPRQEELKKCADVVLTTWFSGGFGTNELMVRLSYPRSISQPQLFYE